MINKEECKKCFYGTIRMVSINENGTINTKIACCKDRKDKYVFVDELDICPLEIETKECKCIICDKTCNVPKKKITGLYVHVCNECKTAIKYAKELIIRHDDT